MGDAKDIEAPNSVVILGTTATGKTTLACLLATRLKGEILSADSRQVYKGLDIGSGKDLSEYHNVDRGDGAAIDIPYHLIDIASLKDEYSVYDYQKDFYKEYKAVQERGLLPIVVGGTGLYLDAVIRGYNLVSIPKDDTLEERLKSLSLDELRKLLEALEPLHHTTSDFRDKVRLIRAIQIAQYKLTNKLSSPTIKAPVAFTPLILGVKEERHIVRSRIEKRLKARFNLGLIEEVKSLVAQGIPYIRLERLGLEYKYVALYLQGKIASKEELYTLLYTAICQFSKRQETWFRGMVKKGANIHYLPQGLSDIERLQAALKLCRLYLKH